MVITFYNRCFAMMYLFELLYQVLKDTYFTDKIATHSYNIYYSKYVSDDYWNYALISDLCPAKFVADEIEQRFSQIKRASNIYLSSTAAQDLKELQNRRYKVGFTDIWMRYEGEVKNTAIKARRVTTEREKEDFTKVFTKYFSSPNRFFSSLPPQIIANLRKSLDNENLGHFITYDGNRPVAIGSLGHYHRYCLLINFAVDPDYLESEHKQAILKACADYFRQINGLSLNINIYSDNQLEKFYSENGFRKIASGCRMYL